MDAEIVTTGTEILLGEIVDTNAAWMARRLRDLGINVFFKSTVGDNLERITAVLQHALQRADLVLVSGGLGPTVDDVTRDAAAAAAGRPLALDEDCLASIEAIFARWGRAVHENNRRQAFLPAGARPVPNPVGTAPGFIVEVERSGRRSPALLICLPGVPREMKHLMQETVEPFLAERLGPERAIIKSRTLRTAGIGESVIDARIDDLMRCSNPTVGLAAHLGQVDIRVTAKASDASRADALIEPVVAELRARLGSVIYGEGEEELEAVVARALQAAQYSLLLAETNTAGEIARRLLAAPGGSQTLRSARVLTAADWPSGDRAQLTSQQAADWLASQLQAEAPVAGPCLALSVCGTMDSAAGPYGAYRGETFMALATPGGLIRQRFDFGGMGEVAQRWVSNAALNWLRLWLEQR